MYPVYPLLAFLTKKYKISLRKVAEKLHISHPYLLSLYDFSTIPEFELSPENSKNQNEDIFKVIPFTYKYIDELINELASNFNYDINKLASNIDIGSDYLFFHMRKYFQKILFPYYAPPYVERGPIAEFIRMFYINDDVNDDTIHFILPHDELLADILDNSINRYYSPDSFNKRKPRHWRYKPPLYKTRLNNIVIMEGSNEKDLIYYHPNSDNFFLLVFYILLKKFSISLTGDFSLCHCNNLSSTSIDNDLKELTHIRYYCNLFNNNDIMRAKFVFNPPSLYYSILKRKYIDVPEEISINFCLPSLFYVNSYCWCLSEKN